MDQYQCISTQEAADLIDQGAAIVDIRDAQSFFGLHIKDALNLSNDNLHDFMAEADMDKPLIVCCYHGISSQSAAGFLVQQGFDKVYSLDGGFEAWRAAFPDRCER
ncbi:thiosulfate sulfurtransferase GlpE [Marinobacterium zhoushanense]|uniref:Thiosulfate sulfurtransferase GlpE n=1 Tax=Marinobacterium zhoushanense TaxID=1679163 RepID=A0ABQ1KTT0_9GAMM|nr:thiosulfate sulfurtransferase GlpE [Marinobacterium zhoushanense]GGC06553.1 thiosulfate sulfurtransferase GlpE [Marinobacterium zhoushanense]